jgi:hypothetical protein
MEAGKSWMAGSGPAMTATNLCGAVIPDALTTTVSLSWSASSARPMH